MSHEISFQTHEVHIPVQAVQPAISMCEPCPQMKPEASKIPQLGVTKRTNGSPPPRLSGGSATQLERGHILDRAANRHNRVFGDLRTARWILSYARQLRGLDERSLSVLDNLSRDASTCLLTTSQAPQQHLTRRTLQHSFNQQRR